MVEFPLQWVIILAGAFLALAVGFAVILVYLLFLRSKEQNPKRNAGEPSKPGLFARLDDRLFNRQEKEPEMVMAPPAQGEAGQNWLLLYRQPENEKLTLSLPGNEVVLKPEQLTDVQLMKVKSMALGLQHWLGLTRSQPVKAAQPAPQLPVQDPSPVVPLTPEITSPPASSSAAMPLTRSIFSRREVEEVKPMVSIARQINAVLQNILLMENYGGPELYLTDNEQGDLVVVLGIEKFIGIDAVPDPAVAALIKRAADQWTDQNLTRR